VIPWGNCNLEVLGFGSPSPQPSPKWGEGARAQNEIFYSSFAHLLKDRNFSFFVTSNVVFRKYKAKSPAPLLPPWEKGLGDEGLPSTLRQSLNPFTTQKPIDLLQISRNLSRVGAIFQAGCQIILTNIGSPRSWKPVTAVF
jgi:hypothetical protein